MEYTDIFIIGGGINGCAIAADAAGRGLRVILCEKGDLAAATSSASTKLIHGGLRYLAQYDFALVRTALHERSVLMRKAPNLIVPLEFVLPYEKQSRPFWLVRLGLFFYDHLSRKNKLPHSKVIHFKKDNRGDALKSHFLKGFSYYDCFTDDARLTVENALTAHEHGAIILTRHSFVSATRERDGWKIAVKNLEENKTVYYQAKVLINAAGPWVEQVQKAAGSLKKLAVTLVKGSHIIVPKLFAGNFAYILQNADNRIVFAIPYHEKFTLIGTTDTHFPGDLDELAITQGEENYLCNAINHYFKKTISPQDIITSYAGVRCLQSQDAENLSEISRDYKILLENENNLPLITLVGGKITTHRMLAEQVVNQLAAFFHGLKPAWTAKVPLPGSDFPQHDFAGFTAKFRQDFPWLPAELIEHYSKNYGTRAYQLLDQAKSMADLGEKFSAGFYQKELDYLIQHEWAKTAEDVLWRRTKLGLFFTRDEERKLEEWMSSHC